MTKVIKNIDIRVHVDNAGVRSFPNVEKWKLAEDNTLRIDQKIEYGTETTFFHPDFWKSVSIMQEVEGED